MLIFSGIVLRQVAPKSPVVPESSQVVERWCVGVPSKVA